MSQKVGLILNKNCRFKVNSTEDIILVFINCSGVAKGEGVARGPRTPRNWPGPPVGPPDSGSEKFIPGYRQG